MGTGSDAVGGKPAARWNRVVLKVSGEAFAGPDGFGIDGEIVGQIADEIVAVRAGFDVELAVVVGGGNIWRGMSGAGAGMDRAQADYMGMLATTINALALQDTLEQLGQPTRVQSAIDMAQIAEPYIRRRAIRHLQKGRVVIFAGGTGNPFFTTDTAAALRAVEMNCDALFKGTQVDGVYDSDPKENKKAKRFDKLTYQEVLTQDLRVMDASAIALARENEVPILVFSIHNPGGFAEVVFGEGTYTIIN